MTEHAGKYTAQERNTGGSATNGGPADKDPADSGRGPADRDAAASPRGAAPSERDLELDARLTTEELAETAAELRERAEAGHRVRDAAAQRLASVRQGVDTGAERMQALIVTAKHNPARTILVTVGTLALARKLRRRKDKPTRKDKH